MGVGVFRTRAGERIDLPAAALAATRWLSNPVSEDGAAQLFKIMYAAGAPGLRSVIRMMEEHPEGHRLLKELPDLGAALNDMDALSKLPEGSMGRTYYEFMSDPEVVPGYVLAGLAYKDGGFDRVEWSEEMKWLLERGANTHDMTHMLSGYGADLAGETLNIAFNIGVNYPASLPTFIGSAVVAEASVLTALIYNPACGRARWISYMHEAYLRGVASARAVPFYCIDFERLLPHPLSDVRRWLGIAPPKDPVVLDTGTWFTGRFAEKVASGFGAMDRMMDRVNYIKALVAAGIPVRDIMSAEKKTAERACERLAQGASKEEVIQVLGA